MGWLDARLESDCWAASAQWLRNNRRDVCGRLGGKHDTIGARLTAMNGLCCSCTGGAYSELLAAVWLRGAERARQWLSDAAALHNTAACADLAGRSDISRACDSAAKS